MVLRMYQQHRRFVPALILAALAAWSVPAWSITNSALGQNGSTALDTTDASVTLNRIGAVATAVAAEIDPISAPVDVVQAFSLDLLPDIGPSDVGFDTIVLNLPADLLTPSLDGVQVASTPLTANCPATGLEYCATIAGNLLTVTLGTPVTTDATPLGFELSGRTPAAPTTLSFAGNIAHAGYPAFAAVPMAAGNADGDPFDANQLDVDVQLDVADALLSTVVADPTLVLADGISASVITITLVNGDGQPLAGRTVAVSSSRGASDILQQPLSVTDANGQTTALLRSTVTGATIVSAIATDDGVNLADTAEVFFTQGETLRIDKRTLQPRATVGDLVTYEIEIRNTSTNPVTMVTLRDSPPPTLKYVTGSTRLDSAAISDPTGNAPLEFALGTVPGLVDTNGNGTADPGEPGYLRLRYTLVAGAGMRPGTHSNTAIATDACDQCPVSNLAEATIEAVPDLEFDQATIIGKVYHDENGNGYQDRGEPGIGAAMVALDDGTYALTDDYGRYHFPAVHPGQRLVKLNLHSVPGVARVTDDPLKVLGITPGLLAKANFGVALQNETLQLGRDAVMGIAVDAISELLPSQVVGSTLTQTVLLNGVPLPRRSAEVRLSSRDLSDVVELDGDALRSPVTFAFIAENATEAVAWRLTIAHGDQPIRELSGEGPPPAAVAWDGVDENGQLVEAGEIYSYHIALNFTDGTRSLSPLNLFGVNTRQAIALSLRGGAFESGSAILTDRAVRLLGDAADALAQYPNEQVVLAGHTDSVGSDDYNLQLSEDRARAALKFLVEERGIDPARFVVIAHGESRPVADNATAAGREQNRRVEVRGDFAAGDYAALYEQRSRKAAVRINGTPIDQGEHGRFLTNVKHPADNIIDIDLVGRTGQLSRTQVRLPELVLQVPDQPIRVPYDSDSGRVRVGPADANRAGDETLVNYRLAARTAPGTVVEIDGKPVQVDADGMIDATLALVAGDNVFSIEARTPAGISRIANLSINVAERDANGPVIAVDPIPSLIVHLPPKGVPLTQPRMPLSGVTDPGNRITVNGGEVAVADNGAFKGTVELVPGVNTLAVEVTDPRGFHGGFEREVVLNDTPLFYMALVEGKFAQIKRSGNLRAAGVDESSEVAIDGRVAFYVKGRVAGKYLLTSAYDSGGSGEDPWFKDLDAIDDERLLRNLDPDKMYTVYGDDSTVVYDAQSQGDFYLALESDTIAALVGNYAINFAGTELAAFQRTFHGVRLSYRSPTDDDKTPPATEAEVFAARHRQAHIVDELNATGGSLYFLSQPNVIEGSEQVTLLVRDQQTGIVVQRIPQQRNIDYTVKYDEGRILFRRPLASVVDDDNLISTGLLLGSPVTVLVNYETRIDDMRESIAGVRLTQRLGENLTLGGTYVNDKQPGATYTLGGLDAELRIGDHHRITAEVAQSSGGDARTFFSEDGGFSYQQRADAADQDGRAYKLALELDVGALIGRPNNIELSAYAKRLDSGFTANASRADQGSDRYGMQLSYALNERSSVQLSHDDQRWRDGGARASQSSLRWRRDAAKLRLETELSWRILDDGAGQRTDDLLAAARITYQWSDRMRATFEHQTGMSGDAGRVTTVGLDYDVTDSLMVTGKAAVSDQGSASQLGVAWDVDGRRVYVNREFGGLQGNAFGGQTVVGAEQTVGNGGKVYTEYQWRNAEGGTLSTVTGLRRDWQLGERLSVLLSAEHYALDATNGTLRNDALVAGFNYDNERGVKFSTRNEWRRQRGDQRLDQLLTVNHLEIGLNPDFTMLGRYRYSRTENDGNADESLEFDEASIGLAYRPVDNDRLNVLMRVTRLGDQPLAQNGEAPLKSVSDVFSMDWSYQLRRNVEWVGKHALRFRRQDGADVILRHTETSLSLQRLNLALRPRFRLGLEYRLLTQEEAADQRQGWLSELMWDVFDHQSIGVGYNFSDFSDDLYSENDYSEQGWFLRLHGKY